MSGPRGPIVYAVVLLTLVTPGRALAQTDPQAATSTSGESTTSRSNLWMTVGIAFTTARGDCQTCELDYPYRHSAAVLSNIGYRVHGRMDVGAEVFWIPETTSAGDIRITHLDGVAQFRPWRSKGFFLKGGAGMAFVRNWVDAVGNTPITSKALSVVVGGGWAYRTTDRLGIEVFAVQHAAALGDLQTGITGVSDVMINFWSVGAALVIR